MTEITVKTGATQISDKFIETEQLKNLLLPYQSKHLKLSVFINLLTSIKRRIIIPFIPLTAVAL